MPTADPGSSPDPTPVKLRTLIALMALGWALIALAIVSLAPTARVPQIFHNYHVEHFAAFYLVALLSAAALPTFRLFKLGLILALLATALAALRLFDIVHKVLYIEDLFCDYCGVMAALVPIVVGGVRNVGRAYLRE
jgi:hypothetical protein